MLHEALTAAGATTAAATAAATTTTAAASIPSSSPSSVASAAGTGLERPLSAPLPPRPPTLALGSLSLQINPAGAAAAAAATGAAIATEGEPASLALTGSAGGHEPQQQAISSSSSSLDKGASPPLPPLLPVSGGRLSKTHSLRRRHSSYSGADGRPLRRRLSSTSSFLSSSVSMLAAHPQVEGIRGLSDDDVTFLRSKLLVQPNSDMVRGKDFEAFSLWCVVDWEMGVCLRARQTRGLVPFFPSAL